MSVEHLAVVLHHSQAKGTAKLVLLGIANHAGDGGAWPSVATLARYANATPRQVQRCITKLVETGEVRAMIQAGGLAETPDHQRPNRYDVTVVCPPWCDRSAQHRDTRRLAGPQSSLWTDRVTPTSPGDTSVRGGVTPVSPGGVTPVSPEPSLEHQRTSGGALPPGHARVDNATCSECGLARWSCEARASVNGHAFTPTRRSAAS